ncbi:hypothetical protein GQ473_03585 [archaeon]|nr:hypothetical protein [archaeon]
MNLKNKRKGQYLAIEEVLLFGMGMVIFGGTLLLVTDFRENVSANAGILQLEEVSQNMVNNLNVLRVMGSNAELTVEIPKTVAGESYQLIGSENSNELLVYTYSGMIVQTNTSIKVLGTVSSSYGKVNIKNIGQKAIMRGVTNY